MEGEEEAGGRRDGGEVGGWGGEGSVGVGYVGGFGEDDGGDWVAEGGVLCRVWWADGGGGDGGEGLGGCVGVGCYGGDGVAEGGGGWVVGGIVGVVVVAHIGMENAAEVLARGEALVVVCVGIRDKGRVGNDGGEGVADPRGLNVAWWWRYRLQRCLGGR